ncbi:hypothetical protein FRC02_002976 [Tulasnella sp. 418]|nr:hypothetical protein FRC02_002976 [Tulasnella sp. 418]
MLSVSHLIGHRRSPSSCSTITTTSHSRATSWGSSRSFMTETDASSIYEDSPPPSPCEQSFKIVTHEEAKATGVQDSLSYSTLRDRRKAREADLPPLSPKSTPSRSIVVQQSGSMDVAMMKDLINVAFEKTSFASTVSFSMSPNASFSSLKPHTLVDAMEYLSIRLSEVTAMVLVVDFYMLEELERLTPILSRFYQLDHLVILDSQADPPNDSPMLRSILRKWSRACPSLACVKFREDTKWIVEECSLEKGDASCEWVEYYGADDIIEYARNPTQSAEMVEISPSSLQKNRRIENRNTFGVFQYFLRRN